MGSLLFRYIAWRIAVWTMIVLATFGGLFLVFSLLEELRNVGSLIEDFSLVMLKMPDVIARLVPGSCAIGAALALATCESRRELVMMRLFGITLYRLAGWLLVVGLIAMLLYLTLTELVVVRSLAERRDLQLRESGSFIDDSESVWLRLSNGYVRIGGISLDGKVLSEVTGFEIGEKGLERIFRASTAIEQDGKWLLRSVIELQSRPSGWVRSQHRKQIWSEPLTSRMLATFSVDPTQLSILNLRQTADDLRSVGHNPVAYEHALANRLADAMSIPLLMLVALWTIRFNPRPRPGSVQKAAMLALLVALIYYFGAASGRQYALESGANLGLASLFPILALGVAIGTRFLLDNRLAPS